MKFSFKGMSYAGWTSRRLRNLVWSSQRHRINQWGPSLRYWWQLIVFMVLWCCISESLLRPGRGFGFLHRNYHGFAPAANIVIGPPGQEEQIVIKLTTDHFLSLLLYDTVFRGCRLRMIVFFRERGKLGGHHDHLMFLQIVMAAQFSFWPTDRL